MGEIVTHPFYNSRRGVIGCLKDNFSVSAGSTLS